MSLYDQNLWFYCLSINEAAAIISKDLIYSGYGKGTNLLQGVEFSEDDEIVKIPPAILSKVINALIFSVREKELKAERIIKNLDGEIDLDSTLISFDAIREWAETRDIPLDNAWSDYADQEAELFLSIQVELERQRSLLASGDINRWHERAEELRSEMLLEKYMSLRVENDRLRTEIAELNSSNQVDSDLDKPLSRSNQRHKERCRAIAAFLWSKNSDLTIADMILRDEITLYGCEGKTYSEKVLRGWISDLCPNRAPGRRPSSR